MSLIYGDLGISCDSTFSNCAVIWFNCGSFQLACFCVTCMRPESGVEWSGVQWKGVCVHHQRGRGQWHIWLKKKNCMVSYSSYQPIYPFQKASNAPWFFLWQNSPFFLLKKIPKQNGQGNFLEFFQWTCLWNRQDFWRICVYF